MNKIIRIDDIKDLEYNENGYEDLLDKIEFGYFIPIKNQLGIIDTFVSSFVDMNEHGVYTYNAILYQVYCVLLTFSMFSNIDLSNDNQESYDVIMKLHLNDVNGFGHYYDYTCTLLDASIDNIMKQNTYEYILARKSTELLNVIDKVGNALSTMLDKGDPNTIAKYFSKGVEVLAKKMPDFSKIDVNNVNTKINKKI